MPRGRQRFSFLERALKAAGGSAAAGSKLGNYKDFKEGKRKIEVSKKLTAAERKKYAVSILPFNITAPTTPENEDRYRATITAYSDSGRKTLTPLTDAALGYGPLSPENNLSDLFEPAQLKLFVPTNATTPVITSVTSGVTGQKYSRTAGASYTVPFGRGGTILSAGEQTRRLALAQLAKTGNGSSVKATGISYVPEYFSASQGEVAALPTT